MILKTYKDEVKEEFFHLIDFWIKYSPDERNGGFIGTINKDNQPVYSSKSMVSTARTLWGFSAAIRFIKTRTELASEAYRLPVLERLCKRAFEYIINHFWDHTHRGVYWSVNAEGRPENTKKAMYAHSFFVYGMMSISGLPVLNLL